MECDDYYCLGYNTAGFIAHVTQGTKDCCQETARQIRPHYKSVRVVDYDTGIVLIDKDHEKYFEEKDYYYYG